MSASVKDDNMPTVYMLIGVPAAGKSTWIANQHFDPENTVILSTDKLIDAEAAAKGKTYDQVFQGAIKRATAVMKADLAMAIRDNMDICWDQTNTTVKSRKGKLASFPANYRKVAVFFRTPDDAEHQRRLLSRPGKTIPTAVINSMKAQLEEPQADEGWDEIVYVG